MTSNALAYLRNTSISLVVFTCYKTGMGTTVKCLLCNRKSTSKGVAPGAFLLVEAPEPLPQQLLVRPQRDMSQGTDAGKE